MKELQHRLSLAIHVLRGRPIMSKINIFTNKNGRTEIRMKPNTRIQDCIFKDNNEQKGGEDE